jgi:hypothetical protein
MSFNMGEDFIDRFLHNGGLRSAGKTLAETGEKVDTRSVYFSFSWNLAFLIKFIRTTVPVLTGSVNLKYN